MFSSLIFGESGFTEEPTCKEPTKTADSTSGLLIICQEPEHLRVPGAQTPHSAGVEKRVLRVREHPLSEQAHPLTAKSTLLKLKKNLVKYLVILRGCSVSPRTKNFLRRMFYSAFDEE